jgi:hypothetical protein
MAILKQGGSSDDDYGKGGKRRPVFKNSAFIAPNKTKDANQS